MLITKQLLYDGMSRNGGWSKKQLDLLGVTYPLVKGWIDEIIGQEVTESAGSIFLALKDDHLISLSTNSNNTRI